MTDVVPETPPPANRGLWMLVIGLGIAILLVVDAMIGKAIRRVWISPPPQAASAATLPQATFRPGEALELNLDLEAGASVADARLEGRMLVVRITAPTSDQVLLIDHETSRVISRIRFNRRSAAPAE